MEIKIKYFKSITEEVSLTFDESNMISLIGENGAGKSNVLDAIYHLGYNIQDEKENITISNKDLSSNLRVSYIEKLDELEIIELKKILNKYDLSVEGKEVKKYFFKDINSFFSNIFKSYFYDLNQEFMKIYNIYNKKFPTINLLEEMKFSDNFLKNNEDIKQKKIYLISKTKLKSLKEINAEDWSFLKDLTNDIEVVHDIFKKKYLNIYYSKNAENENNIEYTYDFAQYEEDNETRVAIDFFVEDPLKIIELIKRNNDGTKQSEAIIDREKGHIKKFAKSKMADIFNNLNIYARPRIEIDGNNLKIFVETVNNYSTNDDISTKNNSSGYKSILWILLKLEQIIQHSKKTNENCIFLLDEPDKNIHPLLQQQMIEYIKTKIKDTKVKVIYTTHSPFLMSQEIKNLVVSRRKDGSTTLSSTIKSLSSFYPKIMNTKLLESPIFKFGYSGSVFFVSESAKNLSGVEEVKQFISIKKGNNPIRVEYINEDNASNMEAISSLEEFNKNVKFSDGDNKNYFIPTELIEEMSKDNESEN